MTDGDVRFVDLYERHYGKLVSYCRRRTTPDQVDDAVAETFLTAWRKIDQAPADQQALPWLYAIAYRAIGHQYRSSSRKHRLETKLAGLGTTVPETSEELMVLDQESRQVLEALASLRQMDQEVLRLSVWEGLTHRETGIVLGISEEAAKKRYARARTALARSYDRLDRSHISPAAQKGGAW